MQQNLYSQQQRVEQASNLFHSEYLEHMRVKLSQTPNNIFLTNKKNTSPIKEHVKEYSEILDLEKRNMRVFNLYYVFFLLFLLKDSNVTTLAKFFRNLS